MDTKFKILHQDDSGARITKFKTAHGWVENAVLHACCNKDGSQASYP